MTDNIPDFSKVWGQNSPLTPYEFSDADYLRGWDFVGSVPPSRTMFDAFMKNADSKMKWLYDNAFSDEMLGKFLAWRQSNTAYFVGMRRRLINAPLDIYLVCVTAGMTSNDEIRELPEDAKIGGTIEDGTVVWQIMQFANTLDVEKSGLNILRRNKTYEVGDIAYSPLLKSYRYLECTTAGTTADTDITDAATGTSISDGSVVWLVRDVRDAIKAESATKATQDSAGQKINNTYIKGLSVNGRIITYTKGDGTTGTITTQDNNTTYSNMKGATTSAAGSAGLVPAPATGAANRYLRSDGTWQVPPDNNTTYSVVTQSTNGLMSAADKKKIDNLAANAGGTVAQSLGENGYVKFANGLIIQWGYNKLFSSDTNSSTSTTVTFPTTFSNAVFMVIVSAQFQKGFDGGYNRIIYKDSTKFTVQYSMNSYWIAIGM